MSRRLALGAWLAVLLTGAAARPAHAQACLGAPIERHAIAARLEGGPGNTGFLGAEYAQVHGPVALGVHGGATVEGFPPENPEPAGGGFFAWTGQSQRICPALSVTWWRREFEGLAEAGGVTMSVTRIGVGIGTRGGNDRLTLVAYGFPHFVSRSHTEEAEGFALDLGAGIGGGRFWASGGIRFDAARPGQDVIDGALLFRGGVRF
jgi:hypothetical protein